MDKKQTAEIKQWIGLHLDSIRSGKDVARGLGVDIDLLRKRFGGIERCALSVFIRRLKIERATKLLRSTDLRWKEIVALTGLGTPEHATRLVKRKLGMTPTEYRKQSTDSFSKQPRK